MPLTSIIVPCFNEEATIGLLLEAIHGQTYPHDQIEIIIADGLSTDGTRQRVMEYQKANPGLAIQLIDNPQRSTPAALNKAIQAARGDYIIRLDGHSMPYPDYVERCVAVLEAGQAANAGGIWEIRPGIGNQVSPDASASAIARGIAAAAAHPFGVGDALYRYARQPKVVDTVPFGAFRRDLVEKIGGFDETLLTNEDYEFNVRVRQSGGVVWLDPSIRSIYFARSNLGDLLRQYWRYGFWKARMLIRYPHTLRWRQALPPVLVISLLLLSLFALVFTWARILLSVEASIYLLIVLAVGCHVAFKKRDIGLIFSMPLAIVVMHLPWGTGLLWSLISSFRQRSRLPESPS